MTLVALVPTLALVRATRRARTRAPQAAPDAVVG
jgi:hypothetical protein